MTEEDRVGAIAGTLRAAAAAHHQAFIEVNGHDPEWPQWYADYACDQIGRILDRQVRPQPLAALLVEANAEHQAARGTDWAEFYAGFIAARVGN